MTTLTLDRSVRFAPAAPSAVSLLRRLGEMRAKNRAYQQTRRELRWLSDRELDDLGITRCDIDRVARQAVYGDA
jgi:uncharacterized protein YjiS (DUF1127 family)